MLVSWKWDFVKQDAFAGTKAVAKHNVDALLADDPFESYEEMKKDITALSKEEQMEVVYRYYSLSPLCSRFSRIIFSFICFYINSRRIWGFKLKEKLCLLHDHLSWSNSFYWIFNYQSLYFNHFIVKCKLKSVYLIALTYSWKLIHMSHNTSSTHLGKLLLKVTYNLKVKQKL